MFPSTLLLVVGDSHWRYRYLALAHLLGAAGLLLAALPAVMQWSGIAALVASLFLYTRPKPLLRLRCQADGSLQIGTNANTNAGTNTGTHAQQTDEWQTVEVKGSSCIMPGCVLLRFTQAQKRHCRNLLILSDSMSETDFRHLRIWLRWRARSDTEASLQ